MTQAPARGGGTPTGNALTQAQADAAAAAASQQVISALENLGAQSAQPQGTECLWPPPATFGLGLGIIKFSFGVPCLITKSEARAVIGAGLVAAGVVIMSVGLNWITIGSGGLAVVQLVAGGKVGKAASGGVAEGEAATTGEFHAVEHPQAPTIADAARRSDAQRRYGPAA